MTGDVRRAVWLAGAPLRLLLVAAIRLYRLTLAGIVGGQCRFHPSCSVYAEEAIRTHGAIRGTALAAWRIARCSPLTRGGYDPVPQRKQPARRVGSGLYDGVIHRGATR
jgi:putative membrane protein insertion efficiency factor